MLVTNHPGAALTLPAAVEKLGLVQVLVVTGQAGTDHVRRLVGALPCKVSVTICELAPEPVSEHAAAETAELYTLQGCDGIIAIGAGPAIALACLVGVLAASPGPLSRHLDAAGALRPTGSVPPVIVVADPVAGAPTAQDLTVALADGRSVRLEGPLLVPAVIASGAEAQPA